VVCHNTTEATPDKTTREEAITRLQAELARIADARARTGAAKKSATTTKATTKAEAELAGHVRAECALRDHPTLGRWLWQLPSGRLVIDRAKIAAEERLDGKYLLSTSDPYLSPRDVALGYKNLLEAERGFRDLKSTLGLRPVFHRLEPRIRAHVLLAWLALLLVRLAERRTDQTWATIARELTRLHAVTLTGPFGTVVQATEPTDAQRAILRACQVTPPPRITGLHPLLTCANASPAIPAGVGTRPPPPRHADPPAPQADPTTRRPTNCGTRETGVSQRQGPLRLREGVEGRRFPWSQRAGRAGDEVQGGRPRRPRQARHRKVRHQLPQPRPRDNDMMTQFETSMTKAAASLAGAQNVSAHGMSVQEMNQMRTKGHSMMVQWDLRQAGAAADARPERGGLSRSPG
jgi:hypothetical protein